MKSRTFPQAYSRPGNSRSRVCIPASVVWFCSAVAACLVAGCKTTSPSRYISPRVEGRVLDAETRQPLGGVKVRRVEPTELRMTKLYNLMQDPYERADITSNTYWDWIMNHVPQVYQGMEEVPKFVASFKEFLPRSTPPSFNPANMLEDTLRDIKAKQKLERAFPMLRPEAAK